MKVAVLTAYHNRYFSQIDRKTINIFINLSSDLCKERSSIGFAGKSTFLWIDFMVDGIRIIEAIGLAKLEL